MANADSLHARARFFRPLRAVPRSGRTSTSRDALVRRRAELPTCFTSAYSLLVKYDRLGVNNESLTVNTNTTRPVCDTYDPKVSLRRVGSDADRFERLYSRSHEAVCATRPPPPRTCKTFPLLPHFVVDHKIRPTTKSDRPINPTAAWSDLSAPPTARNASSRTATMPSRPSGGSRGRPGSERIPNAHGVGCQCCGTFAAVAWTWLPPDDGAPMEALRPYRWYLLRRW